MLMKPLAVLFAAMFGVILNHAGAWIVHHDSINYRLPRPLSNAAEVACALGPVLWVAGVILAFPLALGWVLKAAAFWRLARIVALACLALLCALSLAGVIALLGFGATVTLWSAAFVQALNSPTRVAQPSAPPNGAPATGPGISRDTKGPPPLS